MDDTHDTSTLALIGIGAADVGSWEDAPNSSLTPGLDTVQPLAAPPPSPRAVITTTQENGTLTYELRATATHQTAYEARWAMTDQLAELFMNGDGAGSMIAGRLIEEILKHPAATHRREEVRKLLKKWDDEHPDPPAPPSAPAPAHHCNELAAVTAVNTEGPLSAA